MAFAANAGREPAEVGAAATQLGGPQAQGLRDG